MIKTSKSAAALSSSHKNTAADISSSSSTCPDQSARSEVNDGDRQQIEAALASVTKLISNLDAEVSTSHDLQMLVNLAKSWGTDQVPSNWSLGEEQEDLPYGGAELKYDDKS